MATEATETSEPAFIEVQGHVRTIRNQKRRSFVEVGDGSTISSLQALLSPEQAEGLQTGTAIRLAGTLERCPPGKEQSHELHARNVDIVGRSDAESYPIQKKYQSPEFLRTIPHLRLRVPFNALLARLRSECDHHISTYFHANSYVQVHPPMITSSDCEGGGEVFTIEPKSGGDNGSGEAGAQEKPFFGGSKYLTVSSQLHLEAFIHEHTRVWTSSPAFRAEKSDTPRHLSEFHMVEAELRTQSLDEVMDCVENLIRHMVRGLHGSQLADELRSVARDEPTEDSPAAPPKTWTIDQRWNGLRKSYWPRITYSEALRLLEDASESEDADVPKAPAWGSSLQLEHEKFIAAEVGQGSPVFVTHYPSGAKPFYMLPSELSEVDEKSTVACFDLLLPDMCEIVGGSLREHSLEPLEKAMHRSGLLGSRDEDGNSDQSQGLDWYLDLRRYGSVPHGGFGLGLDRLVGYLAGISNVKDVVPWPRHHGRCDG